VSRLAPVFAVGHPRRGPGSNSAFLSLNTKGSHERVKGLMVGADEAAILVPQDLGDGRVRLRRSLTFEAVDLAPTAPQEDGGFVDALRGVKTEAPSREVDACYPRRASRGEPI